MNSLLFYLKARITQVIKLKKKGSLSSNNERHIMSIAIIYRTL